MTQMHSSDTALRLAIVRRGFVTRWRGYDKAEVDELLDTVSSLAEELLDAASDMARNLAEAEAELIINRAEARELRDITAATEALLANTRAELKAARRGQDPHEQDLTAEARLAEAEERLVVAEAELRVLRSAAEGTEWALLEARDDLATEIGARVDTERRLAESESRLAASEAHLAELRRELAAVRFASDEGGLAGILRTEADAAEASRSQGRQELHRLVDEANRRTALTD